MALVHLAAPFEGTTDRFQPISALSADESNQIMRCRGFGKPAPDLPPDGTARFEDFYLEPALVVGLLTSFRGGSFLPDIQTPKTLVLDGDSGGGCILTGQQPEGEATVVAVNVARNGSAELPFDATRG